MTHPNRIKVYFAVRDYWLNNNVPPTYRDIKKTTGLNLSLIFFHVQKMKDACYLDRGRALLLAGTKIVLPPVPEELSEYYQEDNDKPDWELK